MRLAGTGALIASLVLLLLQACGRPPVPEGEDLPTVEEILADFHQALGGEEALAAIRSVRAAARCSGPDGPYTTEIRSTRDGRLLFHQIREGEEGLEHFRAFVNGPYTWSEAVDTGEVEPQPIRVRAMVRSHDFFAWALDFPFLLNGPRVHGRSEVDGEPYFELRLTDNFQRPVRAYFHAETHLLAGLEMFNPLFPKELVTLRIVEWRRVDGVLLPSREIVTDGAGDWDLSYHEIVLNDVDESLFEVPEEILLAAQERQKVRSEALAREPPPAS